LQASIQHCEQINISSFAIATTSYGIPDEVMKASVNQSNAAPECIIEWDHDSSNSDILSYTVSFFNGII